MPVMPASAPVKPVGQPTVAMPTATVPLSRPGAVKPAGFAKPATFNKTTSNDADEPGEQKESPLLLILSIIAAVLALAFCFIQYNTDRILDRAANEQRVFGTPSATSTDEGDGGAAVDEGEENVDEGELEE